MDSVLEYFEVLPTWQKVAWIAVCLSINLILESVTPLFKTKYNRWKHIGTNLLFLVPVFIINLVFGLLTVRLYTVIDSNSFGLLSLFDWPIWAEIVIAVAIFDFIAQYSIHFLLHKFKWMWKLHLVHHSDRVVDVTTATRLHPGDYLLREIGALCVILITGAPISYYMIYRIITIFFTYFTHANIALPLWLDKGISFIFVTPNLHKFHHHFERPWTDKNFGNVFSIWDRIFGTFVYDEPDRIRYGVDVLAEKSDDDFLYQMRLPCDKSIKTDY